MTAHRFTQAPSTIGILVGTVFLAVSLSPSLLPRPVAVQGVLSGLSFAVGYGLGVAAFGVWRFLGLPTAGARYSRTLTIVAGAACALLALAFLWRASSWQNNIRELMGITESPPSGSLLVGLIAAVVFAVLLAVARLFARTFRSLSRWLESHVPPRVSQILGISLAALLFWSLIDGVLLNALLRTADRSFQALDALVEAELPRPWQEYETGSVASLVSWEDLGRQGRRFVSGGPQREDFAAFFGTELPDPIRVYVGLNSAPTPQDRARLALEELKRVGGFERSVLLLVTPTGTGWVDAAGQDTAEYLLRGDVATVAVQYSYLNSPLALVTQGAYGAETARAVFVAIYGHWRSLPAASRPRLFLNGLSLGSLNSDLSFELIDIVNDPFDGALWVGPPFRSETWRRMTRDRDPGSPAWLPKYRRGSVVRFMNQDRGSRESYGPWGAFRIVILQYGSDPITFFDPHMAWREPKWMKPPRAPDVTQDLRWFPVVTMLQVGADMVVGTAPPGFGHEFSPADYIDAWLALMRPEGWTPSEIDRLRGVFKSRE